MQRDNQAVAQHAHPANRFVRAIVAILERDPTRSRRLMRHMFGKNDLTGRSIGVEPVKGIV